MATKKIFQRISLEGSDDIKRQLEELGKAGESAFKKIQDAAKGDITDQAAIDRTRQAFEQLGQAINRLPPQFRQLTQETEQFGATGQKSMSQVSSEANKLGVQIGVVSGLMQFATAKMVAALGRLKSSLSPFELLKGAGETASEISEQADKLTLTIPRWLNLRAAIEAAGGSAEDFVKAVGPLVTVLSKLSLEASNTKIYTLANGATVTVHAFRELTGQSKAAIAELRKFGLSLDDIRKGDIEAMLRKIAQTINAMPQGLAKAAAGIQFFGAQWKDVIEQLLAVGKSSRDLNEEQIKAAKEAADQWTEVGKAVRALKDLIGSVFAGSSFKRAEWLTELIDRTRELVKTWLGLSEVERPKFLEGLGEGASATVFKILIALGNQLAGLWNDVLVPAGRALLGVFRNIASGLGNVSAGQVAAGFIVLAAAVVSLGLALKVLGLVLSPIALLFSPLGIVLIAAGAAAVVFWKQISEGAAKAAALIPQELDQIKQAFGKLLAGDFSGFWDQFATAAISAFGKISAAVLQSQGPLGSLARGLAAVGSDLPGTIGLIVQAFVALGNAAETTANIINRLFGTKLTGTDIAAVAIIGTMTGGFTALAAAASIAGAGISILFGAFTLLAAAFGAVPAAIVAAIVVLEIAIAALVAYKWDSIVAGWNAITGAIGTAASAVGNFVSQIAGIAWDTLKSLGVGAWNAITGAITGAIDAVLKLLGLRGPTGAGAGGGANAPGGIPMARGGLLGGRGTGTSDSNLAWVSRGEHIMPARVVRQPGVLGFLEALRRSGRIPGFAEGGNIGLAKRMEELDLPFSVNIEDRRETSGADVITPVLFGFEESIGATIAKVIQELRAKVLQFHNDIAKAIVSTSNAHIDGMMAVLDALGSSMVDIMNSIADATNDARTGAIAALNTLQGSMLAIADSLKKNTGFASGGLLGGRGTGTSDSNLAWLSRGEYVTPARAVAQPGVLGFLEALRRSGGNLRHVLDGMGRFALGGMVRGPIGIPAFAGGGMTNVTIQFPGLPEISGLRASSGVVDDLRKAAALAQVRSGGRKPSRYS